MPTCFLIFKLNFGVYMGQPRQPLNKQLNGYNPGYSQLRTRVLPMPDCITGITRAACREP